MRQQRTKNSKPARTHLGRMSARRVSPYSRIYSRIFVSSALMLLLLAVCFWVPLAWADGSATLGEYPGSAINGSQGGSVGPLGDTTTGVIDPADVGDGDAGNVATGSLDDSGTKPADEEKTGSTESNSNPGASNPTTSSNQSNSENNDSSSNDVESASVAQYSLTLICNYGSPGTYWASQADYLAGLLSINYQLTNSGPDAAPNLHVTSATANNGVTIVSPLPALGTLGVGDSTIFILQWHVPADVNRFTTQLTICASCDKKDEEDNENDDSNNNLNDDPGNKPDDQPGDTLTVNDPADQGGTLVSSLSLSAAADRTSLPSTGFSLLTAILIALVIAPIGAVLLSLSKTIGKLIRVRQK